ncbi:MAG TPA: hypothetical protein VG056_11755 [Pirellulales bacterium]|nr:hypothetical protein [Pirellulales bacterium]
MVNGRIGLAALLLSLSLSSLFSMTVGSAFAQESPPPTANPEPDPKLMHRTDARPEVPVKAPPPAQTVLLTVPKGTPLQVVLDREVKIGKVGQAIHGRLVEPVYAFDQLVVPIGAEITGKITAIEGPSNGKRTLDALDADFTPARKITIEFDSLALPDGKHIPIQTTVTPGSGQVIEFVTAADPDQKKTAKDVATEKTREAKAEAKREWDDAVAQVETPGKVRRIERYVIDQLPIHPQYIDPGTVYFAELQDPLDFGTEPLTPEMAVSIGSPPPAGSSVRTRLVTPLTSATAQKGDVVQAVLSQPLFDGDRLILPQGSRMIGSVVQAQPARNLSRNGKLRIVFHELVPPDGLEQKIEASLEGVQSGKGQDLKLDSEGGAEAQAPKIRYLQTAIAVGLAVASKGDDVGNHVEGGAGGFKLVGIVIGAAVRSQPLGLAMGAVGASRSIYVHFLARGRDVVFPKNTAMEIGIGVRQEPPPATKPGNDSAMQQ